MAKLTKKLNQADELNNITLQANGKLMNDFGALLVQRGDYYTAVTWFKKAAAMGDELAKANLKKCLRLLKSKHKMILSEDL